jgi:MFS transporter, ACS family, tartrate transporter
VILTALSQNPVWTIAALFLVELGRGPVQGTFWAMPTSMLSGAAAAGGIAFINSVGNLGGFVGPFVMGRLKDTTNDYRAGLFTLAGLLCGASVLALLAKHDPAVERAARAAKREEETGSLRVRAAEGDPNNPKTPDVPIVAELSPP